MRHRLLGNRKNPFDPNVFQHISLIAFFAWVGIGADGLSSANYGPEEAYLAIKHFHFLAPLLAIMIAGTVLIVSASYSQVIVQFPSGGGGYLVASKLIHPNAGPIAGSALVIDYVLTVAVSITSGVDAILSIMPPGWAYLRVPFAIAVVLILMMMNLRGIKESVVILMPIFIVFVITHVGLVSYGFASHFHDAPQRIATGIADANAAFDSVGFTVLLFALLHAFSMGAGTLTGIEAVSNSMLTLKEPRIATGKRTMIYMAVSLSFLAAMLLFNFFLFDTQHVVGMTLNAALFQQITSGWDIAGFDIGHALLWVSLISASLLLFVAAQTGFIGGPRVLANMAEDSWLPHRFAHLSERLVTQNGVMIMTAGAIALILYAKASTSALVMLYAINVFIGFAMSLYGMSRLWISRRATDRKWRRKLLVSGTGFLVCSILLCIMIVMKFTKGAWLIMLVTGALVLLCFYIRNHYRIIKSKIRELDDILGGLPLGDVPVKHESLKSTEPTAVILVQEYGGQGVHVMLNAQRLFGTRFKQYIFLSVGSIDSGAFKGVDEMAELRKKVQKEADKYVTLARSYGLLAESRASCEIDYITEIERLCLQVHEEFPNSVFFAARLLFWKDTIWTRILHNETPLTLQRRLMFHGLQFIVLPVRLQ
jgi:amino acid transporter